MNHHPFASSLLRAALNRRRFLSRLALGTAFFTTPGAFAEALTLTPRQTEGPFYPDKLPLDTDNDLVILKDSTTPAIGEITWLSGRVLNEKGQPINNALVEIWQCDNNGVYLHSRSGGGTAPQDKNFQGYGKFQTNKNGEYLFRTIKPVPYTGRTPHIHIKVKSAADKELLTTQCYVKGVAQNERDGIWKRLDKAQRDSVTVDFFPKPESKTGELLASFNIVLGQTPAE
ncbi:intradiol ring-cleavage dioxygenase [Phragmitibacter flavus]|uniref:Intradiol ring-cleavage dioxygenase n=1 Tax=Phragmitibacter flavus TaxID=2576071 RepID=A0A5R8KJH9_9BACT|nr:protocatechuate 3,4-dioxygenase [Phragmitibacter flavus]TLD71779.1 intradiol ring-cleavage dioxygenase [Phragmitibacter flavus]